MNIVNIKLSSIVPDENQPRNYFGEEEMGLLISSIKKYGIKKPLHLEVNPDGTYIIEDGERRYKAAKELGLKEVPAILTELKNPVQRLIEQFHLQEQQQAWTSTEKAMAITKLAEIMNDTPENIAKLLGLPKSIVGNAIAFGKLVDKKNFQKTNIGLRWADQVNGLRNFIEKIAKDNDIETTKKDIENALYARIRKGEELRNGLFTRIKDSIRQQPKIITEFIENEDLTSDQMFSKTKAKSAYYLRNVSNYAGYFTTNINGFMKEPTTKIDKGTVENVNMAIRHAKMFLDKYAE